jgi:hypothetical protein
VLGNGTPPHYEGSRGGLAGKPVRASSFEPVMRSLTFPTGLLGDRTADHALVEVHRSRRAEPRSNHLTTLAVRRESIHHLPWMRSQVLNASQKASKSSCNS